MELSDSIRKKNRSVEVLNFFLFVTLGNQNYEWRFYHVHGYCCHGHFSLIYWSSQRGKIRFTRMANSFVQPRQNWARITNGNSRLGSKGLFIWTRLTGLAIFPRSRLTSKSFVKFSMGSYERASWLGSRDLGKRAWNFAKWTLHHGYPDERRDEFWRSGWHRLVLPAAFSTS